MKTFKTLPKFESRSNNSKGLKPMTTDEKALLLSLIEQAKANDLKNFALIYNVNGLIFGLKTPLENCLTRIKVNKSGNKIMFKIFSPLAKNQVIEMAENSQLTYFGTVADLEKIRIKHNLQNNGQAVEYLVNRYEHTTINHTQSILEGGDALDGNTEIKYFVIGNSSPSCRLFDNI